MGTFIAVLHIIVALILIGLVLIQDSKGGGALGMGGGGGGGSNSVFGATGASTLAAKMTRIVAVIFALTSIGLSVISARESKSVIDTAPAAAAIPTATTPNPNATPEAAAPAAPDAPAAAPAAPAATPAK